MVKISKPARNDLKQIHEYFARDSLYYAQEVIQSILHHIKQLKKFPLSGRIVPEFNNESIREIIHESYRIVNRKRKDVEIVAVIHAKRDLEEAVKIRLK